MQEAALGRRPALLLLTVVHFPLKSSSQ